MREIVRQFAEDMECVLKENDYKDGWQDCTIEYLEHRLIEEVGEYFGILARGECAPDELLDIANFAMMIRDRRTQ